MAIENGEYLGKSPKTGYVTKFGCFRAHKPFGFNRCFGKSERKAYLHRYFFLPHGMNRKSDRRVRFEHFPALAGEGIVGRLIRGLQFHCGGIRGNYRQMSARQACAGCASGLMTAPPCAPARSPTTAGKDGASYAPAKSTRIVRIVDFERTLAHLSEEHQSILILTYREHRDRREVSDATSVSVRALTYKLPRRAPGRRLSPRSPRPAFTGC